MRGLSRLTKNRKSIPFQLGLAMLSRVPILRWLGPGSTSIGITALAYFLLTGKIELNKLNGITSMLGGGNTELISDDIQPTRLSPMGPSTSETIRIATFNIQAFGEKKSTDNNVMQVLSHVVTQFDVVAIQEVKGGSTAPVDRLVSLINRSGGKFASVVSEPIGRTSQTESYAFVWNQDRIMMIPNSAYVIQDGPSNSNTDRMHREPLVASFQVRPAGIDGRMPFTFTIINAHTDPDEVSGKASINELDVLDDVFVSVRQYEYDSRQEDDCLLVGDLNVNARGLSEMGRIPNLITVAGNLKTNTRGTETYDHILLDRAMTTEFTGRYNVIDFQRDLGLTAEQALLVSDHLPMWAEFSVYESIRPAPLAATHMPSTTQRW